VTARIRETLDMETVLRTAVQEVRQALGLPEVVVRLREPKGRGSPRRSLRVWRQALGSGGSRYA